MIRILHDNNEVIRAVEQMVGEDGHDHLRIGGPSARPVMDAIFRKMDAIGYTGRIELTLPALTGTQALGSSFLFQLYRLAKNIHINPRSVHVMLASSREAMLLSVGPNRDEDNQLCGVLFDDEKAVSEIDGLLQTLWENGTTLRLGKDGKAE